jgi:hypothetical protein
MMAFPADVRALPPVSSVPKVVVLGLVGETVVLVAGIVLTTVGVRLALLFTSIRRRWPYPQEPPTRRETPAVGRGQTDLAQSDLPRRFLT